MASIRGNYPLAEPLAPSKKRTIDARGSSIASSSAETASGDSSKSAQIKIPHPTKVCKTANNPPTESETPHKSRVETAIDLMDLNADKAIPIQPMVQLTSQLARAPSVSSLSAFLPALKSVLPPEQYAAIEAIARTLAASQAIDPSPQSVSSSPQATTEVPSPTTSNKLSPNLPTEPTRPLLPLSTKVGSIPITSRQSELGSISQFDSMSIERAIDKRLEFWYKEEENSVRCQIANCSKRFEDQNFWRIHVNKRHPDWLDGLKDSVSCSTAH